MVTHPRGKCPRTQGTAAGPYDAWWPSGAPLPFGVSNDAPPPPDSGNERDADRAPGPAPSDVHGTEDATLGGYFRVHERPPAFEGSDGQPYSVSIEVEKTPDLTRPFLGYLVFPRWAETGVGIVGHVETPVLWHGASRDDVLEKAGETPLLRVKEILDDAIRRKAEQDDSA